MHARGGGEFGFDLGPDVKPNGHCAASFVIMTGATHAGIFEQGQPRGGCPKPKFPAHPP